MTDSRSPSNPISELDRAARIRIRTTGLAAALVAALLVVLAGSALRQPLLDLYQRVSPPPAPSPRVQVVVVDAESIQALGGWPWSRYVLARLTEQIADRGAAAIGFDFLFPEPDRQAPEDFARLFANELPPATAAQVRALPSMDAVFARVIGRSPVVLARAGVDAGSIDRTASEAAPLPPDVRFAGPQPAAIPAYPAALSNLAILDGSALGHGLANGPPDADGVVRRVPLLGRPHGVLTPSLALELVRVAEGLDEVRLEGDRSALAAVRLGAHRVPVDAGGRVELRIAGRPGVAAYRTTSAADLLRQGLPADAFKGSIVLVGLAAAGTSDVVATPREAETFGVFVQAQAVDALLRSAALARPKWAPVAEWSVGLAFVLLAWFAAPRARPWAATAGALLGVAAAFAASWFAFQGDVVLDPFPMLAPGAAVSAVLVGGLFVEGRRLQARLRAALEDERLAAARIAGELSAAAEIQSGMLLPRAELASISPDVEIDAVLQPARSIGGDLYDAFALADGRVCFLVADVTGKGVPAALFMALAKALSRSLLIRPAAPLDVAVREIDAELSRDNREAMAISVLVGVLDPADGRLDLCCAGHENPLVADGRGGVRELELDGGPPLCAAPGFPYPLETHRLAPGELLVAFTDGLTEAQDPGGELFGRARTADAVAEAGRAATASAAVDGLVARVRGFEAGAEPSDDLTVLAVRRRPPADAKSTNG